MAHKVVVTSRKVAGATRKRQNTLVTFHSHPRLPSLLALTLLAHLLAHMPISSPDFAQKYILKRVDTFLIFIALNIRKRFFYEVFLNDLLL